MILRIQPELVVSHQFSEDEFDYTERDVALYALGVGAPGEDQLDPLELPYVYHPDGQGSIKVLPTFAVIFPARMVEVLKSVPGLHFDPALLLHGEQYLEIYKPLPTQAKIQNRMRIAGLHDKGKAAIIDLECSSRNLDSGEVLCLNRFTCFLRGAGGFSASPAVPFSFSSRTPSRINAPASGNKGIPSFDGPPDATFEQHIHPSQALLYRLSGDYNPLHADPILAAKAGFKQPILHGLCSLGFATRAVIRSFCGGEPSRIRAIQGRFLHHVYPGETIVTEMWRDVANSRVVFRSKVRERGQVVLSGTATLQLVVSNL